MKNLFLICLLLIANILLSQNTSDCNTNGYNKPNVVIIVADDLGYNYNSITGTAMLTPAIKSIANNGIKLNQMRVAPVCTPTRFRLYTAKYPEAHFVDNFIRCPEGYDEIIPDSIRTIFDSFKAINYQTALIGKWHLSNQNYDNPVDGGIVNLDSLSPGDLPYDEGVDYFYGCLSGEVDYYSRLNSACEDYDWWEGTANGLVSVIQPESYYVTHDIRDKAIEYIQSTRDSSENFLLVIPFTAPHKPFQSPNHPVRVEGFNIIDSTSQNQNIELVTTVYKEMITEMDNAIAAILNELDDNTIVVFLSDNGAKGNTHFSENFGDVSNNGLSGNYPLRSTKGDAYDGGIRVPAAIMWKNHIPAGKVLDKNVDAMDIYPTLAEFCGAPYNSNLHNGISISRSLFNNQDVSDTHDVIRFVQRQLKNDFTLPAQANSILDKVFECAIQGCFKLYIRTDSSNLNNITENQELYNICIDQAENNNIKNSEPIIFNNLLTAFQNWESNDFK